MKQEPVIETKSALSDRIKSILTAATKSSNVDDIAAELGVKVQVIYGNIASIKTAELATYEDRKLVLTKTGLAAINVSDKKVKNKDVVAAIINANPDLDKPAVVDLIATTLDIEVVNARVYYYNWEVASGKRQPTKKVAEATDETAEITEEAPSESQAA